MAQELIDDNIFEELLKKYVEETERVLQRELEARGLVSTGDLVESVRARAIARGTEFIKGYVDYSMGLRIKDLRVLHYSRLPSVHSLKEFEDWVGRHIRGEDSRKPRQEPFVPFTYVSGRLKSVVPADQPKMIRRIARAIFFNFRVEPNVVRGYRGVYNDPIKNEVLPRLFYELRQAAGATALTQLRLTFQDFTD